MSDFQLKIEKLPWLPRLSSQFREHCNAILDIPENELGSALQKLSMQYLGFNQMNKLAKISSKLKNEGSDLTPLTPFKLGVVSNATISFLKPCLEASALRYGVALEVVIGDFDQIMQEALNPGSTINLAKPDAILLALDYRGLPFINDSSIKTTVTYNHQLAIEFITQVRNGFHVNCGSPCIIQTLPASLELLFGNMEVAKKGSLRFEISKFNAVLSESLNDSSDYIFDVEWLASSVGLDNWYDNRQWYHARLSFSQSFLPLYSDNLARLIGAIRGKSRKCLVLDLDNTLWGGVIGDDGLDGISLGTGDSLGEAYLSVQSMALNLRKRGVILAVCSKNNEDIAREPFVSHPAMLIKESDIAVFLANWEDKASNLEIIAEALNIGLDSLVFMDDNPFERAQVREALPLVAVPEIGDDPSVFSVILSMAGYFEPVSITEDDQSRAEQYQANLLRNQYKSNVNNIDEFLTSLSMKMFVRPFAVVNRERITQLINKTNQFNLTTKRYTEQEVIELEDSSSHLSIQINLVDRFGDNGTICIVICKKNEDILNIDSWLMSCRVLNRRVEEAVCNYLVSYAKSHDFTRIRGTYIPTKRNKIVQDHFYNLGFEKLDTIGDMECWELKVLAFKTFNPPIEVTCD